MKAAIIQSVGHRQESDNIGLDRPVLPSDLYHAGAATTHYGTQVQTSSVRPEERERLCRGLTAQQGLDLVPPGGSTLGEGKIQAAVLGYGGKSGRERKERVAW